MADAALLCTDCALCCDGVLFDNAALTEDEVARGRAGDAALRRLPVVVEDPRIDAAATRAPGDAPSGGAAAPAPTLRFRQPCPALEGTRCGIYEGRPDVCRGFECKLLVAYRAEEVDLDRARELVRQVRDLGSALRVQLALAPGASIHRALREHARAQTIQSVDALLTIAGLRRLIARHFHDADAAEADERSAKA